MPAADRRESRIRQERRELEEKKRRGSIYTPVMPGSYHGPVFERVYDDGAVTVVDFDERDPR